MLCQLCPSSVPLFSIRALSDNSQTQLWMPKKGFGEGRVLWLSIDVALPGWETKGAQMWKEQSSAALQGLDMEIQGILGIMRYP